MARSKALIFKFSTEKFDYKGDIPEDANAGNKFYGRDVAEYLCAHLNDGRLELDFLDEDWGWLILGEAQSNLPVELSIANHGVSENPELHFATNIWLVRLAMYEKRKILGFFPKKREIVCEAWLVEKLKQVLSTDGITLLNVEYE